MDQNNRPQGREKNVTDGGKGIHKRGEGLGTGKVGNKDYSGQASSGKNVKRAAAGGGGGLVMIIIVLLMIFKGGDLGSMLGGSSGDSGAGQWIGNSSNTSGYSANSETSADTSVAEGSRAKYTVLKGNNQDKITLMVYMCGTDLESKYGMASSDMEEMRQASESFGDSLNIIIYTGGCNNWNRNDLILWDHGGGSISGYGYDEKHKRSASSMDLAGINKALKNAGVKFDFIGFDACLMATAENALMLSEHADYLIASEETEPGIGWYYTNWLKALGSNTSLPTLDTGKSIIDDFVVECSKKCKGQKTTLSIIDLAEFSNTVPDKLLSFSKSISGKIEAEEYKQLSDARYSTREFAESSRIDQVDLVNLAENIGTPEAKELIDVLKKSIKYNRTSSNMTNAYGVSIYFPYKRTSYVDSACDIYDSIGMDDNYSKCIRQFAKLETSGQIAAGGSTSPIGSLFGSLGSSSSSGSAEVIGQLLTSFLGGTSDRSIDGLDRDNTSFMSEGDNTYAADYISDHYFDASKLIWEENDGKYTMELSDSQWDMIHSIDMNMFYDDGSGYLDLGIDNVFTIDDDTLIADTDRTWVAVNGQPVAYYHTDTIKNDEGKTVNMGYVPALLNGIRVKLIIVFEGKEGYIAGAAPDYVSGETDTIAKNTSELQVGDKLDFICDYYSYDKEYQDTYMIGDTMTVTDNMKITNVDVGSGKVLITYLFTDLYNQEYWSEAIKK